MFSLDFISQSLHYLHLNTPRIEKCLDLLSEAEVWHRPNPSSNSVGNLILHLCGNIRQYVIAGLGRRPDARERDAEFSTTGGVLKQELLAGLKTTVREADEVIQRASELDLLTERVVQGIPITGVGIVIHVVEHYSYHAGQIAFWTKYLRDRDLGFYAGVDLNKKNEG